MPHVAITGASRGIGEALARRFAAAGCSLTLIARQRPALEALAASLGRPTYVEAVALDDLDAATAWVSRAEAALGPIDVLINNAGRQTLGPAEDSPGGEASIRLNLLCPIRLMETVGAAMLQRGRGDIVNIASAAALSWMPGMVHYNAGKSGIAAFSESVRAEWLPRGVNVLTVYPGPVRTDMAMEGAAAYGQTWVPMGTAERLANLVFNGVERRKKRIIYPGYYWFTWAFPNITRFVTQLATPKAQAGDSDRTHRRD